MSFLPSVECGKFKLKKAFQRGKILACTKKSKICATSTRGGVLEDTFWSPWPWTQSLKSSKIARTALFLEPLKFCWKTPETSRKICEDLFLFSSRGDRLKKKFFFFAWKKNFKTFYCDRLKEFLKTFFLWRTLASVSLVLGLKRFCPWPRNLFESLASSLVSSTPPLTSTLKLIKTMLKCQVA